jgi:hypothetical protein
MPTQVGQGAAREGVGILERSPGPERRQLHADLRGPAAAQRSSWASRSILFDAEREAATDVPENSTDLPDEVCLALAKFALLPVSRSNSDD